MKSRCLKLAPIILLLLSMTVSAEEPAHRFKAVVDRMVDAINKQDYPRIQKDFNEIMLKAFPLKKSKPFFKDLMTKCGKIESLDSPQLAPPNRV